MVDMTREIDPAEMPSLSWTSAPGHPPLALGAIHLWRIRTNARGAAVDRVLADLAPHERDRAARMQNPRRHDQYVRAAAGLRAVLARYLGEAPDRIAFRYGPWGKPGLASDAPPIAFNLTTTESLALVAVGRGAGPEAEVGIDCEWIRPRRGLAGVAARLFGPQVRDALLVLPETERLDAFYRAWTALEADAKTDGRGLLRAPVPGALRPTVTHFIPESGYIAAVARLHLPPATDWSPFDLDANP
jgi:4'-phosphopantetheinyl transferase